MRFEVLHRTVYRYSGPVRLGPHLLRLTPRPGRVAELCQSLAVTPLPVARRDETDAHGNRVTRLDFAGETPALIFESRFTLRTQAWLEAPEGGPVPPLCAVAPEVAAFAAALGPPGAGPDRFLSALTEALHARIARQIRPDGAAWPAEVTLARGQGACRDLAVLFIAAAASRGIAARFVSGYQAESEHPDGPRHMHAWPEALVPGRGWCGYDPTHGRAVGAGHVALAVAPDQAGTMPVEGGFTAGPVTAAMEVDLRIATGPDDAAPD
ncbi:transglutaminase family protein [Rhodovulum sp. BSW8]|uniref:transglutaminase family protein n=1 Tax=Rhodovulum sp. BSW8 TaxID=2259645 RepID=UPI000DE2C99C|nr:transglutaminase N-terminal domain-containing protein [Rhodovulum sp. BSW8]RBO51171.1 transglutaminase family protein [Rhodovulum sp. BSW8]